jgi:Mce-associated membrane protein
VSAAPPGAPDSTTGVATTTGAATTDAATTTPVAGAAAAAQQPARRRVLLVLSVLGLLLVAVLALLGWQLRGYAALDDRREDVLRAARQSALNLTSIDHESFDQDVARVLEGATGAFRADFEARSDDLRTVLEENEVVSRGKVLEAGLVRSDARTATALVVVDSTVRNTAAPEGRVNTYRMRLQLELRDGRWRTSMLEFVG